MSVLRVIVLGITATASILITGCDSRPSQVQTGSQLDPIATSKAANGESEPIDPSTAQTDQVIVADQIRLAERHIDAGQFNEAESVLQRLLLIDPGNASAKFDMAAVEYAKRRIPEAIALLDEVPADHPQLAIPARGRAADLCLESERFDEAIDRYRHLAALLPNSSLPHRNLAALLNRQGRRHEAAVPLRELCKLGDIRQDELHALMVLSDAIYDDPHENRDSRDGSVRYFPIGQSGLARKLFSDEKYLDAADLLSESVRTRIAVPAMVALYGRCLAEAQDDQRLSEWFPLVDERVKEQAEFWAATGAWLVNQQRFEESIRVLAEAIRRDSTDVRSYRRIHQALVAINRVDEAQKWDTQHQLLRTTTLASNEVGKQAPPDRELLTTIVDGLEKLGRPLESVLWKSVANYYYKDLFADTKELNRQRKTLVASNTAFPNDTLKLCGMDLHALPMPDLKSIKTAPSFAVALPASSWQQEPAVFEEISQDVGIEHVYQVASQTQNSGFTIYQVMGGGVAVLDYDLDGLCDLYFAQGASDPPKFQSRLSDLLYRNQSNLQANSPLQMSDVTEVARVRDNRYSTGVTAGDWNQDGFPDLVVGNLGANALLINRGDGTFSVETTDALNDLTLVTSSIAMADVTGDSLPDIYEQNYVHDPDFTVRPSTNEKGQWEIVSPFDYEPAMDRIFVNDGTGGRVPKDLGNTEADRSTGLGVIIGRFDDSGRNEIYVGNDVRPNQRWALNEKGTWSDIAPITGVALGHDGTRTSSMGIAAGDFDRSGTLDLHITNFERAPSRLFMNQGGTFQDRAISFNLAEDSFDLLGFGTQAIDYNNDGYQDLIVTNGHVENTGIPGSPFEQPPQLFANAGRRFELVSAKDRSGYFAGLHVGRALARLDFDQDGRSDFVVTHLGSRSALVLNRTETANHWLDVQLVGTRCERDAIGARIELTNGEERWTQWMLAGDGYLCRNESSVPFGLGKTSRIDQMEIVWPDGTKQSFTDLEVDQRILVVQDQNEVYAKSFGKERGGR